MNNEEFDALYEESITRLNAYIATQVGERQIAQAKHHKHHVEINEDHYRWHAVEKGAEVYLCSRCGAMESANFCEPSRSQMLESQTCFHCNHWEQLASNPRPNLLIINGHTYSDGGAQPKGTPFLGFGGAVWKIRRDGKEWETNNLWSGGTIPTEFRERLPDNAEFLP